MLESGMPQCRVLCNGLWTATVFNRYLAVI